MLSCKDITEKANDYLERELPLTTRMSVRMHLFLCVHCRRYVNQLRTTIGTLKLMKKESRVSDAHANDLLQMYKQEFQSGDKD